MLTVTDPAADPSVITAESLRLAAGYAADDASHDGDLERLALRVTAEIVTACNVAIGQSDDEAPPTLRREDLIETFRRPRSAELVLSRRHGVAVASIDVDGTVLDDEDFEVDPESGMISRYCSGWPSSWCGQLVTVAYSAGFDTIPADLDAAAADLVRTRIAGDARDPAVKSAQTEVPDVLIERTDFWVGAIPGQSSGGMPDDILARLARYRNAAVA